MKGELPSESNVRKRKSSLYQLLNQKNWYLLTILLNFELFVNMKQ